MLPKNLFRSFVAGLGSLTLALLLTGCGATEVSFQGTAASPATTNLQQKKSQAAETSYFEGTFQDGTTTGWDTKRHLGSKKYLNDPRHYSFQIVQDQWSDDEFAGRFEIRGDDKQISDGWRSEFKDRYYARPGDHASYSFEFLIPKNFINRKETVVIAQWHDSKVEGKKAQRPQLSVRIVAGDLEVYLWNDLMWEESCKRGKCGKGDGILIFRSPVEKERWHEIDLEAVWSGGDDGLLNLKFNGRAVVERPGSNTYREDFEGPYFKFGIYTVHPFEGPIVIYQKNYVRRVINSAPQSQYLKGKGEKRLSWVYYLEAA